MTLQRNLQSTELLPTILRTKGFIRTRSALRPVADAGTSPAPLRCQTCWMYFHARPCVAGLPRVLERVAHLLVERSPTLLASPRRRSVVIISEPRSPEEPPGIPRLRGGPASRRVAKSSSRKSAPRMAPSGVWKRMIYHALRPRGSSRRSFQRFAPACFFQRAPFHFFKRAPRDPTGGQRIKTHRGTRREK